MLHKVCISTYTLSNNNYIRELSNDIRELSKLSNNNDIREI